MDDLTTNQIRAFSSEHYSSHEPLQIEWIDDTSANIVYDSSDIASEALTSFTLPSSGDTSSLHDLQIRSARTFSTHPGLDLRVRIAISTDQKRPRAYEQSRFYLLHPEYDPRERRQRSSRTDGDYHRKRYGKEEHRRRKHGDDKNGFTASMYDDPVEDDSRRRDSRLSFSSGADSGSLKDDSHRLVQSGSRRSRDRSASPGQDNGGRRARRRTPPPRYNSRDPHPFPRGNSTKELFPNKSASEGTDTGLQDISTQTKELFPNKMTTSGFRKELFPLKAGTSVHRRSDAFDAADETADLFASGMSVPFVDGANDRASSLGRLRSSDPDPVAEDLANLERGGFSIRGAAKQTEQGFSIRGVASGAIHGTTVKELFPVKAGNAGKELFAERLHGKGGRRNRAADMFG